MPREIFLDQIADAREAVRTAVTELEAGEVVCLPDECGWHLVGLATHHSSSQLLKIATEASQGQMAVGIPHACMVNDYVTEVSRLFSKLSSRCWPGPVILRGGAGHLEGLARQWPTESQNWALGASGRAFYCPAEPFAQQVLSAVSAPTLSLVGATPDWPSRLSDKEVSLHVRASRPRFTVAPTVVSVQGAKLQVEFQGVVSERMLERLAGEVYMFVCTGNTCRSPMAEAIFRKMLADRLKCREDELMDHGYVVLSAGLAAHRGASANPDAVTLLRREGIDLSEHESQPVTEELLFHCDYIFTMTRSHRDALLSSYPELADQIKLLSPENQDVPDPIGAGIDEYFRCKETITNHLQRLLEGIDFSGNK